VHLLSLFEEVEELPDLFTIYLPKSLPNVER
jgi:hypothetical protein